MTDSAAVEAAVAANVDAIGFVFFEKSPRNVTPAEARTLASDIPKHIRRIAVMLHPEASLWQEVEEVFQPDVLQTDSDDFAYLSVAQGVEQWPVYREGSVDDETALPETYVYEGRKSGHGQTVDWSRAANIAKRGQMILAGGLSIENVGDAILQVRPFGVDVSSAVESSPGKKDAAKIAAFTAAAHRC
ncbi:MAG: phosphoribosylanthranilate isomerase [Woeseia sp.]|nr:phosphoribosylanthranilate isomerase [Woeseia sp.]MBT6211518.1 phosphoribosylanthranilate isomerase [Woeseia sp.]